MAKGKGKGSSFEREFSKFLTEWLSGQKKEYYFWRSPGSGSVSTVTGTNPELHGDIIPIKPEAKEICDYLVFECKNGYKTASIDKHLKYSKDDKILAFWQQVHGDVKKTDKYPVLIFKKLNQQPWIGINTPLFNKTIDYLVELRYNKIHWETEIDDLYLFDMKEFFNKITITDMRKILCID